MKKLLYITIALLSVCSCAQFDDSKIWDEFKNYYNRLEKVEAACDLMNSNISALQAIVTALQSNDYVTGVAEIVEDGEVGVGSKKPQKLNNWGIRTGKNNIGRWISYKNR